MFAAHLNTLGAPKSLLRQVNFGDPVGGREWPPQPGCSPCPDLALARMWARIDLGEWMKHSPSVFGPHKPGELDILADVGAQLRRAGEGAQVLWGIDLVPPPQWFCHTDTGLAVAELVCYGPRLPEQLVNEIDSRLSRVGWWYGSGHAPNRPCTVNRTACFETSWYDANIRPSHPRLARPAG